MYIFNSRDEEWLRGEDGVDEKEEEDAGEGVEGAAVAGTHRGW